MSIDRWFPPCSSAYYREHASLHRETYEVIFDPQKVTSPRLGKKYNTKLALADVYGVCNDGELVMSQWGYCEKGIEVMLEIDDQPKPVYRGKDATHTCVDTT